MTTASFSSERSAASAEGPVGPDYLYALDLASNAVRRLGGDVLFGQYTTRLTLAATPDGSEVLVTVPSGDLHRIVGLPLSGVGPPRSILGLSGQPWKMDAGGEGAVYVDLVERPVEILVSDARARDTARVMVPNVSQTRQQHLLPLPDGRILITIQVAGRNRVMAVMPDGTVSQLLETQEDTSGPMAMVGRETVALMLGSPSDQALALVSTTGGRIEDRLDSLPRVAIRSVAGSPDGRTLYYAAAGQVSAVDLQSGTSRVLHPGDTVAIDPDGQYAVVALRGQDGIRLVKVFLADGRTEDIPNRSEYAIAEWMLQPNAIARDGRIALAIAPEDLWFWPTGILDPQRGEGSMPASCSTDRMKDMLFVMDAT